MCQRAIWIDKGRVFGDGPVHSVVEKYVWYTTTRQQTKTFDVQQQRWGTGDVQIKSVRLLDDTGQPHAIFTTNSSMTIEINYEAPSAIEHPIFGIAVHHGDGTYISGPNTLSSGYRMGTAIGEGTVRYTIPSLALLKGTYYLSVAVCDEDESCMYDYHDRLYSFQVDSSKSDKYGLVTLQGEWSSPHFLEMTEETYEGLYDVNP